MYRILMVDDEEKIRAIVRKYAEFEGNEVVEAADGMEAVKLAKSQDFDIIILDIMMPELDGFSACKEIRKYKDTPVIMLSARGEEYDRIHGFELGIDDYVVTPFSPKELMLRVGAILKRRGGAQENKDVVKIGDLEVDFAGRRVTISGKPVEMTPKEYDLFFYMVRNRGIALTREKLITNVWGYDFYGDERVVDTHIKNLRKKLGIDFIQTIRGVGYKIDKEN